MCTLVIRTQCVSTTVAHTFVVAYLAMKVFSICFDFCCFYKSLGTNKCDNTNECSTMQHDCPHDSKCFDTPGIGNLTFGRLYLILGGYECQCAEGFKKSGKFCVDLNECAIDSMFSCSPDSKLGSSLSACSNQLFHWKPYQSA